MDYFLPFFVLFYPTNLASTNFSTNFHPTNYFREPKKDNLRWQVIFVALKKVKGKEQALPAADYVCHIEEMNI